MTNPEKKRQIRVLLVEDDPCAASDIVRDFGRHEVAVRVTRTLADARAFLRESAGFIDVVILELQLPDGRGESLLPDIEALSRDAAVIIATAFLSEIAPDALEYRPVAVSKPVSTAALLRIVRTVAGGYARSTIERFVTNFGLSKREMEALILLAQGLKAKGIAGRMHCSEPTIYGHLARVCAKCGCTDSHEVMAKLLAFACQARGHTPPEHRAFVDHARQLRTADRR